MRLQAAIATHMPKTVNPTVAQPCVKRERGNGQPEAAIDRTGGSMR